MRIGRLFAVSMLSVTVLAVILGAGVLIPQYRTFAGKTEAIKAVEAYGTVLAVGQQVAAYRAPYVGPLFQEGAATPAQLEVAAKAVQTADAAFAKARTAVGALSDGAVIVQGLNQAAAKLAEVRTASDRAMGLPTSARDQAAIKGFLPGIAGVVGILEPLLNRLENQVAMADASLTALLNVARTSQDLRISAGGRAATVSLAISTRRALTAAEISSMDRAQGRVDLDRERIEAGVDQIGSPPRLAKAMNDAIEAYFGKAAPWLEKEMTVGRNDGKFAIGANELASTIVPAVQAFFAVRDAALAEAGERVGAARDAALTMLALAGLAVMALLGVLAGVTVMLRRRVITPLATLTGAVGDLAAGRHDVTIPTVERADEIGAMAGSLQVFKDALIAKKAADEAAALEADAKIQRGQRVDRITGDFEAMIGQIVEIVSQASTELEASAGTLTATAERSEELATAVAAASEEASTNVQSVASATEEMASSVNEISRQVQGSARIAGEAVEPGAEDQRPRRRTRQGRRPDRRRGGADQHHCGPDQPAGAQRHHRGGAGRRSRARLCGGRVRGEGAGRTDGQSNGRDQPADIGHPGRDPGIGRRHQGDRRYHRTDVGDRLHHRSRRRGAGRGDPGNFPQRAAGRARHAAGFLQHRRRSAWRQRDRVRLGPGARRGKVIVRRKRPAQARGRKIPLLGAGGLSLPLSQKRTLLRRDR
jgi:HAMP domain-containing protein